MTLGVAGIAGLALYVEYRASMAAAAAHVDATTAALAEQVLVVNGLDSTLALAPFHRAFRLWLVMIALAAASLSMPTGPPAPSTAMTGWR